MKKKLNQLSVKEISNKIYKGETTSVKVVESCLERIGEREKEIRAWAHIDQELVLKNALQSDQQSPKGLLHGVPFGVKDIIDTCDMPTEMGSQIYRGRRPLADASCVALVKAAGAIILGKTVTTEFAGSFPGATRNPRDRDRSPGGSSSGSAAAVADFMTPAAFGTQTGSSILRPSSYCGIIGYKPTFGTYNISGIKAASQSLDTLGLHVRSLDDIQLITAVLVNRKYAEIKTLSGAPVIGICKTPLWDIASEETRISLEDAASRLSRSGARIRDISTPESFEGLENARIKINCYERSRHMIYEWSKYKYLLSKVFQEVINTGMNMNYSDYIKAITQTEKCRQDLDKIFDNVDVLIAPCVDGEAPIGIEYAGNPRLPGLWTAVRLPSINLPTHIGPNGLPVSIQVIGRYRADDRLLSTSKWMLQKLGSPTLDLVS